MLGEIRIRDLGVIEEAVVELSPGFTVLTGETGAGKTMIVTSLDLLLGGRADPGVVRSGAGAAWVEGVFTVPYRGAVAERARAAGAELDLASPDEATSPESACGLLLVARSVGRRSRSHVGGRTVPVAVLSDLADELVAVHGQADQVLLRSAARQRDLLDAFAGPHVADLASRHRALFEEWTGVNGQLDSLLSDDRARRQRADLLRHGLAEIEKADPKPREDEDLRALTERLEHAEELTTAAGSAHAALVGTDDDSAGWNCLGLLDTARRSLDAAARVDPTLTEPAARVDELAHLVVDLAADLASYAAGVESDPALLAASHDRRATLGALTRRYGADIDEVLAWAQAAVVQLTELDGDDERVGRLQARRDALDVELDEVGAQLSAARRAAGQRLEEAVAGELAGLSMPGARLSVAVSPRARAVHGADEVTFLLTPHRGADPRPLARGASGGELSRVMLAIEVATAGLADAPTMVFDEVDAGVGGRAAIAIGRRLARLAQATQVIVVTHLPQVAAFADHHLVVEKAGSARTVSGVRAVTGDLRVRELARMLAGVDDSEAARRHAAELLEQARAERG
jgi:DNA repair protein RecN (Recombination protein N)